MNELVKREDAAVAPIQDTPARQPNILEIVQALTRQGVTTDTANVVKTLMDAQDRVEDRRAEAEFNRDFAAAKREMPKVSKDGKVNMGEKGSYDFAKYEDIQDCIGPIEEKWGFARSFESVPSKDVIHMRLVMRHSGGHVDRSSAVELPPDTGAGRNGMQARRSSSSYAKRGLTMDYWDIQVKNSDNDGRTAEPITKEQADQIRDLITEIGMDKEAKDRFLKFAEAKTIPQIQRHNFDRVMQALERKRRNGAAA